MKQTILVVGASGLLGSSWVNYVKSNFKVVGSLHQRQQFESGIDYRHIDFENIRHITNALRSSGANIVVNCAGMTSVDECQVLPCKAFHINSVIPERLAKACSELRLKFVHISTDHIFSGQSSLLLESHTPFPLNVYAESKLLGEKKVLEAYPSSLIIRTNFFGWGPSYRQSFSDYIISTLRAGRKLHLFSDVFFTPLLIQLLIEDVHELIDLDSFGIYNIVGDERVSKLDFGVKLAQVFELDFRLIIPELLGNRKDITKRPLDMSLSNSKLRSVISSETRSLAYQFCRLKALEPTLGGAVR